MSESQDPPHSELYFTESRGSLWNDDFVALMSTRMQLGSARRVLDVGAGQGHFGRTWAPHLAPGFELVGVDREPSWVARAQSWSDEFRARRGLDGSFRYVEGDATALPFGDASFDAVCCQTLLIHVADPSVVVAEMLRVVRPGGLVFAAEPNNLAFLQRAAADWRSCDPDLHTRALEFQLRIMMGKAALGLGWNNVGFDLPHLFRGLNDVRFWQNDKAVSLSAPCASPEEAVVLAERRDHAARAISGWPREEARTYFVAGGGMPHAFDAEYGFALACDRDDLRRIDAGTWHELSGVVLLLAAGRKPL